MLSSRTLLAVIILTFTLTLNAHAAAGTVVEVEFERSYRVAEVNRAAEQVFGDQPAPAAEYEVDVYRMQFYSTALTDEDTVVTTELYVPRAPGVDRGAAPEVRRHAGPQRLDPRARRPLYVFAAGTTGLTDSCRTTREYQVGVNWGRYRQHLLTHAGQGTIGMLPDYMHFGEPNRLQPYFIAEAEGRVLLDAVRAAYTYFSGSAHGARVRPAEGAFLAGFSQGGHAIFAAADIRERYAPEVELGGLIGYGPTTNVEALFREFSVVAPAIIYTYAEHYGSDRFDPAVMLADRWLANLEHDVTRLCILGYQSYYPWGPHPLFLPEFAGALVSGTLAARYPEIHQILSEQQTGLAGHGVPALILQGTNDVVIDQNDQTRFVAQLRERGSNVRYRIFNEAPHDTRQLGFYEATDWMNDRLLELEESNR